VRWSDGSLQLLIGDEVLDVSEVDTTSDHGYLYSRPKAATLLEVDLLFYLANYALLAICSCCFHSLARTVCTRHLHGDDAVPITAWDFKW